MALRGLKVIELAGLAPAPFCGMILSDFGASVTRIDRPEVPVLEDSLGRGKQSVVLRLNCTSGQKILKKLCHTADVLLDPFRSGVMEKLQLGPSILCGENPRLIYARLTGFGQEGPFARMAGHDINYIAVAGVLSSLGHHGKKPCPPINLLGDFAGGGLICALGICMALLERSVSGQGQVIDANMVEGSAYIGSWLWTTRNLNLPLWGNSRGKNLLDGGAPFYQTYETSDGKYMAVGSIEPQFYQQLLEGLNLSPDDCPQYSDWEKTQEAFRKTFASKTQAEWCKIFDFTDACVTPVLPLEKAHEHFHNSESGTFLHDGEKYFPRPAPSLSRTPAKPSLKLPKYGLHTIEVLKEAGYLHKEIEIFLKEGIVQGTKAKL